MAAKDSSDQAAKPAPRDVTGRDRIARNLVGRYLGQIVVIVSGFIIPRLISDTLGAVALGVWDFGWSVVAYFRYMGLGLAAGLNRYVALHNARGDLENLQKTVSSTLYLQLILAGLIAAMAFAISTLMPRIFTDISQEQLEQSKVVVVYLGLTLAVKTAFWPSRGILTGYHLVTVTSAVTAAGDIAVLLGMFLSLRLGGGLTELGLVVLLSTFGMESLRLFMAKRVYRYPMLNRAFVDWKTIKEMVIFGVKNSVSAMPGILSVQTSAVILAANAGPAALAVFARPLALFMNVDRLIHHYAALLTPIAGSLQGLRRNEEIKEFLLTSLQSSYALTLPAVILLGGYGDVIVEIWMGSDYVVPWIAPVMALTFLMPFANAAAMRILVGVNSHGRVALRSLVVTAVTLAIACVWAFWYGWSAMTATVVTGISLMSGLGIVVIVDACRRFDVSLGEYVRGSLLRPMSCNLILLALVVATRLLDRNVTFLEATFWGGIGGLTVVALYWRFLLNDEQRGQLVRKLGGRAPTTS